MQCPRCRAPITSAPDPGGYMVCPGCGARLMSRTAKAKEVAPAPSLDDLPVGDNIPPPVPPPKPRVGSDTTPSSGRSTPRVEPAPERPPASFDEVLAEIRALREGQEEILRLLRSGAAVTASEPEPAPEAEGDVVTSAFEGFRDAVAATPVIRSRRRKTVLVIDDDPEARQAAVTAFEQAEVPVRSVGGGKAGLEAIAQEKPDVIVLELAVAGDMAAKDVINMIKATMEWVDIPIVLYTRAPVENQKEARALHGADEVVGKASGPEALVARVIAIFRSR